MSRSLALLVLCGLCLNAAPVCAEEYGECRLRCETEQTDCVNQPPAPDPDLQAAQLASCERRLAICYAECENLKQVETPAEEINNPNIIRR